MSNLAVAPHPSGPALPAAIQALHAAIAEHPDPQSKQILTTCLGQMMKVQAQDMQRAPSGPAPGPGGPPLGAPPPGGPMGAPPQALADLLGAMGGGPR